jgi:hypothetical protein
MTSETPNDADRRLHETLRQWEVKDSLPPGFRDRVWRRIERREAQLPAGWWSQLLAQVSQGLSRPSLAAGYVTALLLAGLLAGYWQARVENTRATERLGLRYVQMMDPYQMPRH